MAKLDDFVRLLKEGFQQSPPAVHGQIPKGFTLESYREAAQLGLFDNGASPDEVLEMMRQNGTVGKMDGLQYSDGTSDIDRVRSGMNERVGEMNKFEGGAFQDIFPRYQENFQFSGKSRGPYGEGERPTTFKVRRDPDGYRTTANGTFRDIELMQPDINRSDVPDVARMNSYGNGDFIDSQSLLSDKPTYVRSNSYPNDEYLMAPKRKIDQSLKAGDMNLKQMNGELFGSNEDWWKTIGLDELD